MVVLFGGAHSSRVWQRGELGEYNTQPAILMINFPCHCGHRFLFEDDMAGRQVQCPDCGRLNDIPTLDDLRNISEDGTYKLDSPPALQEPGRFEKLHHVYARQKTDALGEEIDLRVTAQEVAAAGAPEIPLIAVGTAPPIPVAPRYDPETGELIRELAVLHDHPPVNPADIPMAKTALHYATRDRARAVHFSQPLLELFMPVNLIVMLFVLIAQVIAGTIPLAVLFITLTMGVTAVLLVFLVLPLLLVCGVGVVAHYANVIEEIGPDDRDELPRFLRNLSIREDIWRPLVNFMASCICCFWPVFVLWHFDPTSHWSGLILTLALILAGSIFFPAVLLTATTSGSLLNLRPDRVLGTIRIIGWTYLILVATLLLAAIFNAAGVLTTSFNGLAIIAQFHKRNWLTFGPLAYTILCTGIYLMHYFCWQLGLVYRRDHHRFPWVLQQHISHRPPPRTASSRAPLPDDMRG